MTKWSKIYAKPTPDFKNHMRNLDNFRQVVESPKSWNSMGYICLKTTFLHLKHYLQIYLILLSTDLWFGKWQGIWQMFSRALKIGILKGSFNPNLKKYELKIHRGVICRDNEELRKIWRGTDLSFQSWHRTLTNLDPSIWKSQKFSF